MKFNLIQWLFSLIQNDKIWSPDANLVIGTNRVNRLTGDNSSSNFIAGFGGNDTIIGGSLSDTLIGGTGVDTLTGGAGADKFVLEREDVLSNRTVNRITDFSVTEGDRLLFDSSVFTGATATMAVVAAGGSRSVQSNLLRSALSSTNSFVYVESTGELWWNQNGSSSGAGTGGIIAVLSNRPTNLNSSVLEMVNV